MDKKLTCYKCDKKASYREKSGELLCQECHCGGKKVSYQTYTGNDSITSTTYIKCPHCGMGDTCGTEACYVYKWCKGCNVRVDGSCTECKEINDLEKEDKKDREQTDKYSKYLKELEQIDTDNVTFKEYKKIKKLQEKVNNLLQEKIESELLKTSIEIFLKKPLEELENNVPCQVVIKAKWIDENRGQVISKDCQHSNIHWRELFQRDETESAYCSDCGEDKNSSFTKAFQKWYCKKVEEWLDKEGLKRWKFTKFLKKKDYYDNWQSLWRGNFFENIKDEFLVFQEMSGYIEDYCCEFAKEEGVNIFKEINNNSNTNHREREKSQQLQTTITQLESKPNLTSEQQELLASKKKELAELEKKLKANNTAIGKENNSEQIFWIAGCGIVGVLVVSLVLIVRKNKRSKNRLWPER